LNEFITPLEYIINFFGMRSYCVRKHRDELGFEMHSNEAIEFFDWLCSISCSANSLACPFCLSSNIKFVTNENLSKPPPKTCSSCGLTAEIYDFRRGLCRWCWLKSLENPIINPRSQRIFSRWVNYSRDKKINTSDLSTDDALNLLAFGKA